MITIAGFVLTIVILVGFHELGHMVAARAMGVRVLEWSIGFGPRLWSKRGASGTQYSIALIPLGGFVRMLHRIDLEEMAPLLAPAPAEQRSLGVYESHPIWRRSVIVVAGPLANMVLAALLFMAALWVPQYDLDTRIASVRPDSLAQAYGFEAGDQWILINQRRAYGWNQHNLYLYFNALLGKRVTFTLEDDTGAIKPIVVDFSDIQVGLRQLNVLTEVLGLEPETIELPAVIGDVVEGLSADRAGLKALDRIVEFEHETVRNWSDFVAKMRHIPATQTELELTVLREQQLLNKTLLLHWEPQARYPIIGVQVHQPSDLPSQAIRIPAPSLTHSLAHSFEKLLQINVLHGILLYDLFAQFSEASANLGGPIAIAQASGQSLAQGLRQYLEMLAILSISLGFINLLPVPVLDGGHLMLLGLEKLRGRPLGATSDRIVHGFGAALIVVLIGWTLVKDLRFL